MLLNKLVTVIIPTYNRAHFLLTAIKSVQNQTYSNIQIIVVDDGSTDNTRALVENLEDVEYYFQENKKQGAARNLGLSKAKGEYIASLDSDDQWHKSFIAESVKCLEKHDLDFVFSNYVYENDSIDFSSEWYRSQLWKKYTKTVSDKWFLLNDKESRQLFIETCPAPSSSLLIKRNSFVRNWNEDVLIADDWCLILDMVLNKPCRAAFTLKPLWVKKLHDQNIYDGQEQIETIKRLGIHDENLLVKRFDSQLSQNEKKIFRQRNAGHYFNIGLWDLRKWGFSKRAFKFLIKSFSISPIGLFSVLNRRVFNRIKNHFFRKPLPNLELSQMPNRD